MPECELRTARISGDPSNDLELLWNTGVWKVHNTLYAQTN